MHQEPSSSRLVADHDPSVPGGHEHLRSFQHRVSRATALLLQRLLREKDGTQPCFGVNELVVAQGRNPIGVDTIRNWHAFSLCFVAKCDPASRQIVWRNGDRDAVTGENANAEFPHFPGGGGE
jgi:hypothetical protein